MPIVQSDWPIRKCCYGLVRPRSDSRQIRREPIGADVEVTVSGSMNRPPY
jgi:hypothetical protein